MDDPTFPPTPHVEPAPPLNGVPAPQSDGDLLPDRPGEPLVVREPSHAAFWLALTVGGIFYITLLIYPGEPRRFALNGLESLPFVALALLAYGGERSDGVKVLTLLYWLFLVGLVGLLSLLCTFLAVATPDTLEWMNGASPGAKPPNSNTLFLPGGPVHLAAVALGVFLAVGIGFAGYLPATRRAAARGVPLDPYSFVHAVALATVLGMTTVLIVPLLVLGEPPLLLMSQHVADREVAQVMSQEGSLRDSLYGLAWLVPATVLAVGCPVARTLPEALRRLGLVRPRLDQVMFALLAAGVLVIMMMFVDAGIKGLWGWLGWRTTDEKAFEGLMKFALDPYGIGAVVIGLTAGLGEELFARGVLQPRLGIVLSNLFFTALHALQYNWDGLLSVFLIGLILGVIRKRTNTTTSAIVHGTYDFTLIMLTVWQIDPTKWFGW